MKKRVGVIGGGQLAWMMARGAEKLGIDLMVQTPNPTDPAVSIATQTVLAAIADADATAKLATLSDVITFENEFIDLPALKVLAQQGVPFYPSLEALAPLLNKSDQRAYIQSLGLPTPHFITLDAEPSSKIDWDSTLKQFNGFPLVLKTCRLGYDGQGTAIVRDLPELLTTWEKWHKQPILIEEFVPFERELAVMIARSIDGEIQLYPVVETQQGNQVCRRVFVSNDLAPDVIQQVGAIASTLVTQLRYVGVMGIEFFLTKAGQVLINETAPRTHNSGHYTLDACETSQFEQQLRAVCGFPLGNPTLTCQAAVMVNLLGYEQAESDYLEKRHQLSQLPQAHVYWYGKSQSRPGRKLGHVTILVPEHPPEQERSQLLSIAERVESIWYP